MIIRFILRALVAALGLFLLVINAGMLELVAFFLHGFTVKSFVAALLGSIVVSVVSWIGSFFIESATRQRA